MVWGIVHWVHLIFAAIWIGAMFGYAVLALPVLERVPFPLRAALLLRVLKVAAAVGWASVTFLTITGLALTFHWVPIERYESEYGTLFLAKLGLVVVLFMTYVMFYFNRHQRLQAVLNAGMEAGTFSGEMVEEAGRHLARMRFYNLINLFLAGLVTLLVEMAVYS